MAECNTVAVIRETAQEIITALSWERRKSPFDFCMIYGSEYSWSTNLAISVITALSARATDTRAMHYLYRRYLADEDGDNISYCLVQSRVEGTLWITELSFIERWSLGNRTFFNYIATICYSYWASNFAEFYFGSFQSTMKVKSNYLALSKYRKYKRKFS